MIEISPLKEIDYDRWNILIRSYMACYKTARPDTDNQNLWRHIKDGKEILTVGAQIGGQLVGFSHYLFHSSQENAPLL